jgi:hypothetical protein
MDPYASVIIPSHDRAATLAAAVASVQRQTVPNIEILIVGDGATAEVTSVAQALAAADPRVRFHAFEKGPTDGGLNIDRAVHSAHSERIFFNDDDDVWLRQHVEVIGPLLETADIADTFPVSVGAMVTAQGQRLHGTLVNGANEHIRRLLANDRLKLTFDTHVAHRKIVLHRSRQPASNNPRIFDHGPVKGVCIREPHALVDACHDHSPFAAWRGARRSFGRTTARRDRIVACAFCAVDASGALPASGFYFASAAHVVCGGCAGRRYSRKLLVAIWHSLGPPAPYGVRA